MKSGNVEVRDVENHLSETHLDAQRLPLPPSPLWKVNWPVRHPKNWRCQPSLPLLPRLSVQKGLLGEPLKDLHVPLTARAQGVQSSRADERSEDADVEYGVRGSEVEVLERIVLRADQRFH